MEKDHVYLSFEPDLGVACSVPALMLAASWMGGVNIKLREGLGRACSFYSCAG